MNTEPVKVTDPMAGVRVLLLLILGAIICGIVYFATRENRSPMRAHSPEEVYRNIDQSADMKALARKEGSGLGEVARTIYGAISEEDAKAIGAMEALKVYEKMPTLRDEFVAGYIAGYFGHAQ